MSFLFNKHKKQLEAIFYWLSSVVNQNDLILLEREGKREGYYFKFPLKFGDKPEKLKCVDDKDFTFFIKFSSCRPDIDKKEWKLIFQSPELEIYESKKRFDGKQFRPLRWGLNEEEKRTALKIARESMRIFLEEKQAPQIKDFNFPLAAVFNLRADLDVALWVNGALRGSAVVENTVLSEGIIQASIYASRDSRFKPLEFDELKDARIEIALFSDLKIPLSKSLMDKNEIFYDKGYLIRKGSKEGWFLPQVFNVSLFKTLKEFLSRLGSEKAFLQEEEIFDSRTEFFIFEVDDFIESGDRKGVLSLDGPIALLKNQNITIEKSASSAADWLLRIQESDGNFIPIIHPLTGRTSQIDWPRSIFTGWSLIEFGATIGNSKYVEAGRRNFAYAKKYLLDESVMNDANGVALSLAYLGQEALSLNQWQEAFCCGTKILEKKDQLRFEPILFLQIGSFFMELSKSDRNFWEPALRFTAFTTSMFEQNLSRNQIIHFAPWAELPNLCLKLFKITEGAHYLKTARESIDLFLGNQLDSGAFKSATNSNFVFSRGTGKIVEALAGILSLKNEQINEVFGLAHYRKCLERALDWLKTTQYTPENSYFIPQKNLGLVMGGLRHDYFNPDLWIDSAAHLILAASRFLRAN